MKILLSAFIVLFAIGAASGQTYTDVLRYSFLTPQGSARFAGTGGSLTPMGVDATTLHTNPAGIGWNRYNMAQVTPGFTFTGTRADLAGDVDASSVNESAANFNLPSIGAVFAGTTRSVNWSTLNFGVSVTRMADLNQQIRFDGRTPGSIIESFAETIDINVSDPYGADLALPFLIEDPATNRVYSDFYDFDAQQPRNEPVQRNGLYDRRGSVNEAALGIGGNYRDRVLWGFSLGVPFFSFDEVLTYEEVDDQDVIPAFENSTYDQNLSNTGTGFNLKFGLTALPTEQIRISAAVHTPTYWTIDEQFATNFGYFYTDPDTGSPEGGTELSPQLSQAYNLRTPWRFLAGVGALIGTRGFVSLDADYVNYKGNTISFDDFATANEVSDAVNADVDALLSSAFSVRVGGELNVDPLQLRAGVGYRQIPYADIFDNEDSAILTYNAGVGYSVGKFFVDLAAQYESYASFQLPYTTLDISGQTINTDRSRVSVLLSVGFRGWGTGF
ncbi:hypothetical protein [Lewinella sp. IMCC34183]|uniref:hypothetical protein n=1 Tax=Lewinella sp. IMCC34183 TaxID=2248762 RepID=UPI000E258C08|nr:hypothetical protein [Lewinella sp. IMCC34183]